MRRCIALRECSATFSRRCPPLPQRRGFADQKDSSLPKANEVAGKRPDTYRIDSENKKVETVVGDLPLSPVMDPEYWATRNRYKKAKPTAGKPLSAEERQFEVNIFGKAFALMTSSHTR